MVFNLYRHTIAPIVEIGMTYSVVIGLIGQSADDGCLIAALIARNGVAKIRLGCLLQFELIPTVRRGRGVRPG